MRRQQLDAVYDGSVTVVFRALCETLAFRRWPRGADASDGLPGAGQSYRHRMGSVERSGRVVEVMRPVGLTLKEVLHDPPCRVSLTLRWRIEPAPEGSVLRLFASYRLNHAAILRARHWDARLAQNLRRQLYFLGHNLDRAAGAAVESHPPVNPVPRKRR